MSSIPIIISSSSIRAILTTGLSGSKRIRKSISYASSLIRNSITIRRRRSTISFCKNTGSSKPSKSCRATTLSTCILYWVIARHGTTTHKIAGTRSTLNTTAIRIFKILFPIAVIIRIIITKPWASVSKVKVWQVPLLSTQVFVIPHLVRNPQLISMDTRLLTHDFKLQISEPWFFYIVQIMNILLKIRILVFNYLGLWIPVFTGMTSNFYRGLFDIYVSFLYSSITLSCLLVRFFPKTLFRIV